MSTLTEKLTTLVEPLLASLGLSLWGLEFLPASRGVLRIYIEKDSFAIENIDGSDMGVEHSEQGGVERSEQAGIDECAKASRLIGLTLDVEDIIPGAYVLEVSTPGLERVFFSPAQLAQYGGQVVELALHSPEGSHPGRKRFCGRLAINDGGEKNFSLELLNAADLSPEDAPALDFDWDNVKKARLVYVTPEKPGAPKHKEPRQKKK